MTRQVLHVPVEKVIPSIRAILESQGIPGHIHPDERTTRLAQEAVSLYDKLARPVGVLTEIDKNQFSTVFDGEGRNDEASPVGPIHHAADGLALFAVTIGKPVCDEISRLFKECDYPLGAMLDSTASEGAELASQAVEEFQRGLWQKKGRFNGQYGTLRFSPGYCGWDITSQRKLFEALQPGEIGITLNSSCLMSPIKSVSGVIISGEKQIFEFDDTFPFCRDCATHTCRNRIRELFDQ